MAVLNLVLDRPPADVWSVLRDGHSYAEWVAGTQQILGVDATWPEVGSKLRFRAGIGPLAYEDKTVVRRLESDRLELEAFAGPIGTARVSIEVHAWGEKQALVIIDEHPLTGVAARWHNSLMEVLLRVRNRRMAASLKSIVEERHPPH